MTRYARICSSSAPLARMLALLAGFFICFQPGRAEEPLEFTVELETVMTHDDGNFLWFHPRAAKIPGTSQRPPSMMLTIQKHLMVSDYYSGLHFMTRGGVNGPWTGPILRPELDWRQLPQGVTVSLADVTPGYHPPSDRLLAIGCRVRYSPAGKQLDDVHRAHQTVYAVFDPDTSEWTSWQTLELPPNPHFNFARNACSQWHVKEDGTLLVPLYVAESARHRFSTTVAECRFEDGTLQFVRNGNLLRIDVGRGLYEPSLIAYRGRYFLTLRNDEAAYVSVSDDGLKFSEPKKWTFDDGTELGSYNTQQHWLAHSDGLFLVYTRRGADNDHILRHRAPLFMARVDADKLHVIRSTEKIAVPERGAQLGNFGANPVNRAESWITVSEGLFREDARERGAEGATFVARIRWSKPNLLADPAVGSTTNELQ